MTMRTNEVLPGGRTRRTLATTGAALVALCSLVSGCVFSGDEGEAMDVVWDTPADRKAEPQGEGAWLSGDTLVRSRFDAVSGFDALTGKRSWEYVPPGRSAVCHATADTEGSVLVLTRDGDGVSASAKGKPCATAVAIDMKDGRELWKAPLSEPDPVRLQHSSVSAGSGVAVLLQKDDLHAVDVRTGKSRWKAALPKDCVPGRTAVAERQVAALLACGGTDNIWGDKVTDDAELHVATFDPATGALQWSAPLGGRRAILWDASAEFVSADPVIVAASESNDSEAGAYLSFGRNGRPNPPIDFSGPYGEIEFDDRLRATADGDRLYLLPRHRKVDRLTVFDLATGDAVWGGTRHDDLYEGDSGYQLVLQDGKLTLLTSHRGGPYRLHDFDPATGKRSVVRVLPDGLGPVDKLLTYENRLIVARYDAYSTGSRPFTAYERR